MPPRLSAALLSAALALGCNAALAQEKSGKKAESKQVAKKDQPAAGDAELAHRNKTAMCIGCHGIPGYKTAFPSVYHVPKIAGQQPAYLVNALKAYKSGERSHPSMRGIAGSLTEEEMNQIAAYYAGGK